MTVYVIIALWSDRPSKIHGVFTSKEEAQEVIDRYNTLYASHMFIETLELDGHYL
jgi:hypothetical protein